MTGRGPGDEDAVLHCHRAERADALVGALADVLSEPLSDPFRGEVVAVHSRGIERWLAQELSMGLGAGPGRHDGIAANIEFPFPGRLVDRIVAAALGRSTEDDGHDPWRPERLVWPLMELVNAEAGTPELGPLAALARSEEAGQRRFSALRHVADVFDAYAVRRPDMLLSWRDAKSPDLGADLRTALGPADAWQPYVWRRLHERIGLPSPAERRPQALAALQQADAALLDRLDLPRRIGLFGLTALPPSYLDVLAGLAVHLDVHLYLLHPSPALWARVESAGGEGSGDASRRRLPSREQDPSRALVRHPLLASWGRDAREMQLVVGQHAVEEHVHAIAAASSTLLGALQSGLRADERPPGSPQDGAPDERVVIAADDGTVQVHGCHGRTRQVEVLRDALLHLLAEDDSLEPRDIVVLCPDVEEFAPLVDAVFRGTAGHLPDLRVRLADRALRQTNPVLRVVARLLELAGDRLTRSEVLDLATAGPVRARFGWGDDELTRLEGWIEAADVRWGLDAAHRAGYGLDDVPASTWRSGLDRLLLGAAMADEDLRMLGGRTPVDDVEGDLIALGRFAELIDRLDTHLAALRREQPIEAWEKALLAAAAALTRTSESDRWQHLQLERLLADVVDEAAGSPAPLTLTELRSLLEDRLRGRPSRTNHRTGDLTVCTLVPMRAVPHRVVALLGMDDAVFPRRTAPDGDDLVERAPRVGDRDARTEDRQLLLDATLSATEHLIVTYTARDERTNEPRPPCVPIAELLDVLDRSGRPEAGGPLTGHVVTEHPLQAFDPACFLPDRLQPGGPWGFDPAAYAGAGALTAERVEPAPLLAAPLDPLPPEDVALDALVRFLEHPVRSFLRSVLGVALDRDADADEETLPVELAGLQGWQVGDRLLRGRLDGDPMERLIAVERGRDALPPGVLGERATGKIATLVEALVVAVEERSGDASPDAPTARGIDLELADGRRLVGRVTGLVGTTVVRSSYSRLKAKHRLAAWVRLLALHATDPTAGWTASVVGRSPASSKDVAVATLVPPADGAGTPGSAARALLADLVDLYDRGHREPLPLYCETSAAWASARAQDKDADDAEHAAHGQWYTSYTFPQEDRDPAHLLLHGGQVEIEELLAEAPAEGEDWCGGDEDTRFGQYARRVWDPLLAAEEVEHA